MLKRAFDVVAAGTALLVLSPLLLPIAALLRASTRTVYMFCDQGRLAHVRVANAIRVESSALAAFVGAQRKAPR